MKDTKGKILESALSLFNRNGLVNVRLQHIADEAFVSVGNLAYHYANKEAIVLALYDLLAERQDALLAEYRAVPLFDNIDHLIRHSFHLQEQFIFFYLDTLEVARAYPPVGDAHRRRVQHQIGQLRTMLDFNAARGALLPPLQPEEFHRVAEQLWMTMDGWRYQWAIRQSDEAPEPEAYRLAVWSLLVPYFSAMGRQEYQQMLERPYDFFF